MPLGGGTSLQKSGIEDSPDRYFSDLINWHDYRFSDRDIVRAFADWSAPTFEWLKDQGVVFRDQAPGLADGGPPTVKRSQAPVWTAGLSAISPTGANGTALMRPLEASARKLGVQILLSHSLTSVIRKEPFAGLCGTGPANQGKTVNIQARKGIIVATGGHTSNVNFRRIFDPRLTEEYQVVGEPYSRQTGDGEIAAMRIGASLWGAANQTVETKARTHVFEKPGVIGCQYGYPRPGGGTTPELTASPIFNQFRAVGLPVKDYQDVIHVNQVGLRFVNEAAIGFDWWNPCLAVNGGHGNGGGPIWAIFDAEGDTRGGVRTPHVDPTAGFQRLFSAELAAESSASISQPAAAPAGAAARYNPSWMREQMSTSKPSPNTRSRRRPFTRRGRRPASDASRAQINAKAQ
jgi:hypothetical protein